MGGCEAPEDRGEEGRCSATLARQEDRRERRRKWKNLINEIIPQSTSIRLHSAVALHTRRQAARQAGGGVSIQSVEKTTKWMRVFLCVCCYYQGQCWAKLHSCLHYHWSSLPTVLEKRFYWTHISHLLKDCPLLTNTGCSGLCKVMAFALKHTSDLSVCPPSLFHSLPLPLVIYSTHAEWQAAFCSKTLASTWVMWICVHADVRISVTSFCLVWDMTHISLCRKVARIAI